MNEQANSIRNVSYANVLATLTNENGNCVDSLHSHSLDSESAFAAELVEMDELTIVTSNGQVSGRLASRIITEDLDTITNSKSLNIDPEDILQQSCHIGDQPLTFKTSPISQSKVNKWKFSTQLGHSVIKRNSNDLFLRTNINNGETVSVSSNNDINNFINLSVNKLPLQTTNNTAVEQPNIGPCSCFICGHVLINPCERFSYLKSQTLFSMKVTLLQLLSDIVNQTVITNTEAIDLCSKCSELMNEADNTYKHLNDLKEEITKLFTINKRPKLTFHILPKPSSALIPKNCVLKKSKDINLSELACSRPRRGRGSKKKSLKNKSITEMLENEKPVKKKGGRPRKPFQCHICRRKFLTPSLIDKHLFKEHNIQSNTAESFMENSSISITGMGKEFNSDDLIKQENLDDEKDCIEKYETSENDDKKPQVLSLIQQDISKLSLMEAVNTVQPTVRPIQPKPQTVVQTAVDGSLIYLMNPTTSEASPTLIKVSPGYLNLKTGNYTCELCQKTFLDDKGYKMHKIAAHGVRKRKSDENNLDESNKETYQKIWQCDHCGEIFSSRKLLCDHKKLSHESTCKGIPSKEGKKDKMYPCDSCELIFSYKYEMENHRETHFPFNQVGPHEFVCCICGLKVASKSALKIHFHRFHNKDETKDFLCSECGYMTGTKKAFSDHLKIHDTNPGQKKMCHLCKKEMLPSSFKIHMIRMHGEAKYPCEMCGQRFTMRSDLMKHLNTIHSSIKPYDCILCNDKFSTSEALRYHKNKVHSTMFHFCEICGKNYKWKGELRTHMNRCHSDPSTRQQCSSCSRSYADRRKLYHHMINKHNAAKNIFSSKKQIEDKETRLKANNNEDVVTSGYEPQGNMLGPPQNMLTPIPCSSSHTNIHLVTGNESITTIQDYSDDQQAPLTTLHEMQRHQTHHELHYHEPQIHVSTSHGGGVLTHQTLSSTLIPLHSKVDHLSQEVQSIYLVSEMQMSIPDKSVTSS